MVILEIVENNKILRNQIKMLNEPGAGDNI